MLSRKTLTKIDQILQWNQVHLNHACYTNDPGIANQLKEIVRLREILQKGNDVNNDNYIVGANQLIKLFEESIDCLKSGEVERYVPDIDYMGDKENIIRMAKNHVSDIGAFNLPINTYSLDIISALLLLVEKLSQQLEKQEC